MPPRARRIHHLARRLEIGGHRLLNLHVLFRLGADLQRLQPKIGERADIHVIHARMPAHLLEARHKLAAIFIGKRAPALSIDIGANNQFIADIGVSLRVLMRNRPSPNHPNAHKCGSSVPRLLQFFSLRPFPVPQMLTSIPRLRNAAAFAASARFAASASGRIRHLNVIGLVPRHHLIARNAVRHRVHDGPLRRGDAPAALSFLARQVANRRAPQIGLEFAVVHENAAPDDLARLADALHRAAAQAEIHGRLPLAHRAPRIRR